MNAGKLLLGCAAAVTCIVLAGQSVPADEKPAAKPAAADTYTVIVHRVEVETTNKDGKAWDINDGKPDLAVIVRNLSDKDQKEFQTKEATDTFVGEYNAPSTIKVSPDQTLQFEVVDRDVAVNDLIGKMDRKVGGADGLKEGKMKFESFGRVKVLEIELKKL